MKETRCEIVRRELEELMLTDECSTSATRHLRECDDCRVFHQQQTKLRQIVGSLGTVEAPADFDFRLRARLANESSSAGFHFRALTWFFASKGFAVATMLLLFVGGGVLYLRTMVNRQDAKTNVAEQRSEPAQPAPKPVENKAIDQNQTPVVASDNASKRAGGNRPVAPRAKAPLTAVDFSSERPTVFSDAQRHSTIFPIDASLESLKVSLDDGRGNARTISVPTITFGSQRVLPAGNQFAQKSNGGVWY